MTDPITDRQWGAYVAVCAERDRYRSALEWVSGDHFAVFGMRCRCGSDECPVIAALTQEDK